ncbi:helix-turn-helix transcriptional regulator [Clostridium sardiniense]
MILNVGKVIQRLRRIKGLTQEQLAEAVGVSKPAVSKWENGYAYPDITLLSPIARLLDTTIDGLLEFKEKLTDKDIEEILSICSNNFTSKDYKEAYEDCEKYLKEYPNDLGLKLKIASLYFTQLPLITTEESQNSLMDRVMELTKEASVCEDIEISKSALLSLTSYYIMLQDNDKALETAQKLPSESTDTNLLIATIYYNKGEIEKSKKMYQEMLIKNLGNCGMNLLSLARIAEKNKEFDKSIKLLEALIKLHNLFDSPNNGMAAYITLAEAYARNGCEKESIEALKKSEPLIKCRLENIYEDLSNNIFFDTLEISKKTISKEYLKETITTLLEGNKTFDKIKENTEFQEIIKRIKE